MNMSYVERHITQKAKALLAIFPCLVILGSRQSGKTELSKQLGVDWDYFDLEDPQTYDRVHDDLRFFFKQNSRRIIIDEAQVSGDIFKVLRGVIDSDRKLPTDSIFFL